MQSRTGGLANRIQIQNGRSTLEIRKNPSTGIMGRRSNRYRLLGDVDTTLKATLVYGREALLNEIGFH